MRRVNGLAPINLFVVVVVASRTGSKGRRFRREVRPPVLGVTTNASYPGGYVLLRDTRVKAGSLMTARAVLIDLAS